MHYADICLEEVLLLLCLPWGTTAQNEIAYRNETTEIAFLKETGNICCMFFGTAN